MNAFIVARILTIFCLIILICHTGHSQEEDIQYIDGIVVTASRTPVVYSDLARAVTVYGPAEIEKIPAHSIADLLFGVLGADIRRRGTHGVQADFGLRGSTFEQTLILIDGIKVSDPQTGHHNLDLPVTPYEVDRIEVLGGAASRLYGPNSMAGVVNIITKKQSRKNVFFESTVGDFGLAQWQVGTSLPAGMFTASRSNSSGYHHNTEFDILTLSYSSACQTGAGPINFSARYSNKEFGAYEFYSEFFPDEWEATEALLINAGAELKSGQFSVTPKVFWRRHNDDFILDRNRPNWYRNLHTTDRYGVEVQADYTTSRSSIVLGAELSEEKIESSTLGDHKRLKGGLFFESRTMFLERLSVIPGAMLYRYSDDDWKFWPGIDIGCQISTRIMTYISIGRAFRMPTFTELYYRSPANSGNPDLLPEQSWSYEIGVRRQDKYLAVNLAGFVRDGENLIDWSKSNVEDSAWQVRNISNVTTKGIEIGIALKPRNILADFPVSNINVQYAYLHSERSTGDYISKYALDHLEHQFGASLNWKWISSIKQSLKLSYFRRLTDEDYLIVDTRLIYNYNKISLFAEITNLFDADYIEVGTVPMPGRWFKIGVRYDAPII